MISGEAQHVRRHRFHKAVGHPDESGNSVRRIVVKDAVAQLLELNVLCVLSLSVIGVAMDLVQIH